MLAIAAKNRNIINIANAENGEMINTSSNVMTKRDNTVRFIAKLLNLER
jgi:hypothetical protein